LHVLTVLLPFHVQDLLLERNALLEHAYAMVAGSGQGPGSQPNGSRDRDAAGVDHEATAWWLTQEMQVQTAGTSTTQKHLEQRIQHTGVCTQRSTR
jgi:hypothetical protein